MTTTHYTNSKGQLVEIATMVYTHLKSAYLKAVRTEERLHENAHARGEDYDNAPREAEITAMQVELVRRDTERAAGGGVEDGAGG